MDIIAGAWIEARLGTLLFRAIVFPVQPNYSPCSGAKTSLFRAGELWRPDRAEAMQEAHGFSISTQSPIRPDLRPSGNTPIFVAGARQLLCRIHPAIKPLSPQALARRP
jgi:hypothetical protein